MFGTEYLLALMKIMTNIGFAIVTAIPVQFCWNRIIPKYAAAYIPEMYQKLPFWDTAAILFLIVIVGEYIGHLVPKIISVKQEVGK